MDTAELVKTVDLNYKGGYVECACGWRKDLGDGFNGYHIANCPACTPGLRTRIQRKVIYWDKKRHSLRADIGQNVYFNIKGSITVRYAARATRTEWGTERYLDRL